MTAMVDRLGLGAHVVGRTPWCTTRVGGVEENVAVVGDLREFDGERLVRLGPTHLLVQPPRSGIDAGLERLAQGQGWAVYARSIDGIEDIRRVLTELPAVLAAGDEPLHRQLVERAAIIDLAIVEALAPDASGRSDSRPDNTSDPGRPRPSAAADASPVLLLFGVDPPMAFGPGSYLGDILERLGGRNAIGVRGYPQLSLEDVVRARPRTIVLVKAQLPTAFPEAASAAEILPAAWSSLGLKAVEFGAVGRLVDPAAFVPGPDVARLAHGLRRLLAECADRSRHPTRSKPRLDHDGAGAGAAAAVTGRREAGVLP